MHHRQFVWLGNRGQKPAAFSLVELVVVIGIIGILVALLMPALAASAESAKTVQCQSNLHQISVAFFTYANEYKGALPSFSGWNVYPDGSSPEDEPGLAWTEELEPAIGVTPLSQIYNCPAFPTGQTQNYFLSSKWAASHGRRNLRFADIVLSSYFILSGDTTSPGMYSPPFGISHHTTIDCDKSDEAIEALLFADEPNGVDIHRSGNNVLFADGHVASFRTFDITLMTYDVAEMKSWTDVHP